MLKVNVANLKEIAPSLHAGDEIWLSGTIYTARDAAHKRFFSLLQEGKELPIPLKGSVLYYAGPTPAKNGMAVGACGPTTSSRMDPYTPHLLDLGMAGMIGKGDRSQDVYDAIARNGAIYFCAIGGAGALASSCIKSMEVLAFDDLGCESVKKMEIQDFPLFVGIDCQKNSLFRRKETI
jgi:fumarate hydratase subunit beta